MTPEDMVLLKRWLSLIDRLRDRGALTPEETSALRVMAMEAIT